MLLSFACFIFPVLMPVRPDNGHGMSSRDQAVNKSIEDIELAVSQD